uniref:Chlorophyll a-b binding protein, chloroplastic n=1 Tax=Mesostigma viride TaxID=41882 RepID=A2SY26_MESVI|nr:light-harvesting chlorophyll-a/b binding protein Lhcp1 [Mesostigma viride]DAA05919.1 TPA_inf: chloroplast light-harvesting complex protein precursor Lhcp1.2 [Mesostigma viride]|eukprot:jgi/Mesvir1/2239/Mv01135-RA.1
MAAVASLATTFLGAAVAQKAQKTATPARRVAARAGTEPLYVESGASTYSGNYDEALWPNWTEGKTEAQIAYNVEVELIHGRWAMLGCAGAWAAEQGTGINWFQAGAICTPADCTGIHFPGEVISMAPAGSGFPNFYIQLALSTVAMGLAEGYRGGLIDSCFPELTVGDLHPGGEHFDPLGLANKLDLDRMKIAELKHARLAMLSWLGYMSQAIATNSELAGGNAFGIGAKTWPSFIEGAKGPYANWQDHVANPWVENVWKYAHLFNQ